MEERRISVTIKDVARHAGVALSTASYVLNNKKRSISAATQVRVQEAARELGYQPNLAARSLITRRTHIVALWISEVASPFSAHVTAQTQRAVRKRGYDLIICEIRTSESVREAGESSGWRADGIIAYLGPECRDLPLKTYFPAGTPLVSIGALAVPGTDFVEIDLRRGTEAAVRHLAARGRRRIAYLVPETRIFDGDYRHEAYLSSIRALGRAPEYITVRKNTRADARKSMLNYVWNNSAPDAMFCYNDTLAIGAYRALRDLGLSIPEDVALVGCDGIEDTEYLDCPLSTLVLPTDEMCDLAWRFLERRMRDPEAPMQKTTLYPELEIRGG